MTKRDKNTGQQSQLKIEVSPVLRGTIYKESYRKICFPAEVSNDDGIGFPEGFNAEQAAGLGTSLITMLSEQIDGTVTFENENGANVTVDFFV